MKICHISGLYEPYILGGAETYLGGLTRSLALREDVVVITTRPYSGLRSLRYACESRDGVRVYRFFPANIYHGYDFQHRPIWLRPFWHLVDLWNPHTYWMVRSILEHERPQVVHIHQPMMLSTSALPAVKACGIRMVYTLHDYMLLHRRATLLRGGKVITNFNALDRLYVWIMRHFSAIADMAIGPSQFILDLHLKHGHFGGVERKKLPYFTEPLHKAEPKRYDKTQFLFVGQLVYHKGTAVLIEAFRRLPSRKVLLHIAGTGQEAPKLRQLAGSDSRIVFHGFVRGKQLEDLYRQANVVVVPSIWYDNSPLVIYESFSRGIPVIGSRIGGIPELIDHGVNGMLFEPGDVSSLARVLSHLTNNRSELERLQGNALRSAKDYELTKHLDQLMTMYRSVSACEQRGP